MCVLFKHRYTAPTFIAYGSVWQEIPYYALLLFTAILDTLALFAVKKKKPLPYVADIYRVIHKSLRDFRNRLRNNQDRHGRKEHINR